MLKNYNYMLTIILYPFILMLCYLRFTNIIKSELYIYLIVGMLFIFIPSFIMSLYGISEEILHSKKKWRMIFLILFSIFYIPIYYTKYVSKEEKYLGYILFIIGIPLFILTIKASQDKLYSYLSKIYKNYAVINENYVQYAKDKLFSIGIDKTFRCNNDDIGEYAISCDRLEDDSFIGIYSYDISYDSEEEIEEKMNFHINQTIEYIEENGYTYEFVETSDDSIIQIDYNDNSILMKQNNYEIDDSKYSLIVMKEVPKTLIDYEEYQKMIDSVYFLNYNDGVSS